MRLECPHCHTINTPEAWNEATVKLCLNRSLRRKYVPIEKNNPQKWYECPSCAERFSRPKIKEVR